MSEGHGDSQVRQERNAGEALAESIAIMARLRGPGGCPWDREQTFDTIRPYTLEETYEVLDAIERRAWADLKDELGDLLLQVLFYAQMAGEAGYFGIADVAENLNAKLIRRHPHVFAVNGELAKADNPDAVLRNWDAIKQTEKASAAAGAEPVSELDSLPRTMAALMEAGKIGSRVRKAGFDWPNHKAVLEKVEEELAELRAETEAAEVDARKVEEEIGDLLFSVAQLARHLKVDPEIALRNANGKFRRRFASVEQQGGGFSELKKKSAEELEALWQRAKIAETESGR